MGVEEIKTVDLKPEEFVAEKIAEIREAVGTGTAINALSGGVDSAVVTMLGHKALGDQLKTCFIDNGLMRKNEPETVVELFASLEIPVITVNAQDKFFAALAGITDPEEKREAITRTFYRDVFGGLVRESDAKHLLQGTILTDVDETVAGIKRQHNVFEQLGINPEEAFGYKIIEPLVQIRKDGVRRVGQALGLPRSIYDRPPFPGPALSARVIGEATRERIEIIREATVIVEERLASVGAFQCMAILHEDRVTGIRQGERNFGCQIEVRCWDSVDARTATPTELPFGLLRALADTLTTQAPGVVSVTYNITAKPPSTMEAV